MDQKGFLTNLEDLLDVDSGTISLNDELAALAEWDSLAFVSFLAMADEQYAISIAPTDLRKCKTVGDLMKLIDKGHS